MSKLFNQGFPYILLTICAIFILGANPFAGETVAPTDLLVNQPGWQNLNMNSEVRHTARSDVIDARLPRWIQAKASLRNGELPIWNPYPINGIPGMQWLPAAIFTPAFAVFTAIEDNATGYYFALLTNLLIAAAGCYLLLFTLTNNKLAAIFGSLVFSFSGFHAAWFYWAHTTTSIWIPWVLFFTYKFLSTQKRGYLPWLSLSLALMMFGGFPSVAVYGFIAMGILSLVYAPWSQGFKPVFNNALYLLFSLLIALLITLFAIHSLYEMIQFTGMIDSRHGGSPLKIRNFIRFIFPLQYKYPDVERTFYVGIIPLILFATSLPLLLKKRFALKLGFAVILLLLSTLIAFEILPYKLIAAIPTFDSNNWGRMTVLVALAFAILSAETIAIFSCFDRVKKIPLLPIVAITLLIVIQLFDQKHLFQRFNGPVSSATFFPTTPTIEHIQKTLKPLQSIIIDRAYFVSGTMANYALPEWFAHGFKSKKEFRLLEDEISKNAHRSSTAAAVHCEDVNFSSSYLTLLGIKYIACHEPLSNGKLLRSVLATFGRAPKASAPITPSIPLIQRFDLPNALSFDNLSLKLATHGKPQAHTQVRVRLYSNDLFQGEATVDGTQISDNSWVRFRFPTIITLGTSNNRLEVHTLPSTKRGKLSVWVHPMQSENLYIEHEGTRRDAAVAIKFQKEESLPETIVQRHIEDGLVLLENLSVTGGSYVLPNLDATLKPEFEHITLNSSSPTSYEILYTGTNPGWLVLPVRLYPQWQAYVDNKPVETEPFLGMLPAIQVKPGSQVIYRYEPYRLYWLSLLSLAGLSLTLFLAFKWRHK